MKLFDVWEATQPRNVYTHYTPTGASRIDRIYVTENLIIRKQGVATVAAAFTDHLAVILRLSIEVPLARREKGYWRMNVSFLGESTFQNKLRTYWAKWQRQMNYYPDTLTWWER